MVHYKDKTEALTRFMDLDPELYGVVFCRTKRDTQQLAEQLIKQGYRADAIHGDLSQHQRDRVMMRFKRRELQVLIATDVAARGIDVNDLTHVFHHALPNDAAYYTHRSGRTARAGKKGISLALISRKDRHKVSMLAKTLGVEFAHVDVPRADDIVESRLRGWAMGLLSEEGGKRIPGDLLDQVDLLLGPLTKEELIAKLVSRELSRLNLGKRDDLNDRGGKDDRQGSGKEFRKGGYKKDFKGGFKKGGYKKPFKKGGYKKRSFDGDGFLEGEGGGPKKKGTYKKPFKKKGGFKKGGKKGGYGSGFDDSFSGRSGGRRTKPGSKRH